MKKVQIVLICILGIIIGIMITMSWDWTNLSNAIEESQAQDLNAIEALERTSRAFVAIAKHVTPAVVNISTERSDDLRDELKDTPFHWFFDDDTFNRFFGPRSQRPSRGLGSGVIISKDGYILTNNHVIRNTDKLLIRLSDDREFEAEIIGSDEQTDLAVIKINGDNLPVVNIGDSDKLEVGEWVVAIGNPFGLSETVTAGIVSAKGRNALGLAEYEDFIQTDAAINPGNSGGALVNIRGELIGINTAIETRSGGFQGVGFAIPINMANNIREQLIDYGRVTRGWLGVQIQNVENDVMMNEFNLNNRNGAIVTEVIESNPAAEGGMKSGDVIIKFDDQPVNNTQQLRNLVAAATVGKNVEVVVMRDGSPNTIIVELGRKPDNANLIASNARNQNNNLGLEVQELTETLAGRLGLEQEEGVIVSGIESNSAAAEAGILAEDLVLEIDRNKISSMEDYRIALTDIESGDDVLLLIKRQDSTRFVVIKVP